MAAPALKRLWWQAARVARGLGLAGQMGAGVLALSAGVVVIGLRPMQAERVRVEASALEAERSHLTHPLPARASASEQLAAFEQGFVGDAGIPAAVGRLLDIAAKHRMRIDQAEFKLASEAGQPLQRYAMALPVRGEYRAVRRFVLEALHEQPGLALEELSLRRADPRTAALEAQIRFVLFVRKPDRDVASKGNRPPESTAPQAAVADRPVAMR